MLPVATAPNAIVYQASTMTTTDMMKAGLPLNIICIITTNIAINTYGSMMFGLGSLSDWVIESALHENINCTSTMAL
jgi:sodium-dependent dicarboxylate transporter 2/3/5